MVSAGVALVMAATLSWIRPTQILLGPASTTAEWAMVLSTLAMTLAALAGTIAAALGLVFARSVGRPLAALALVVVAIGIAASAQPALRADLIFGAIDRPRVDDGFDAEPGGSIPW